MSKKKVLYQIKKGELGFNASYDQSKQIVRLETNYDGKQADAGFFIELSVNEYLEMVKVLIPGKIDDAIIEMIKSGMNA